MNLAHLMCLLIGAGIALVVTETNLETSGYIVASFLGVYLLSKIHFRIQNANRSSALVRFYQHLSDIFVVPMMLVRDQFKPGACNVASCFVSAMGLTYFPVAIAGCTSIVALCMGASLVAVISGAIFMVGVVLTYFIFN